MPLSQNFRQAASAFVIFTFISCSANCDSTSVEKTENYLGEASKDGKIVYLENHHVSYGPDGKLLTAVTDYISKEGKKLARLESDFRESLTVPSHTVVNYRTGNEQGIRREGNKLILFDRNPGQGERTKVIEEKDKDDHILVGCQGLNYYLLGNMASTISKKHLPLRFLIPGKLDFYDFELEFVREAEKNIFEFEVTIQNFFLKLFAPKLFVRYDGLNKRLLDYRGLSNITDEKGELQSVSIQYHYNEQTASERSLGKEN